MAEKRRTLERIARARDEDRRAKKSTAKPSTPAAAAAETALPERPVWPEDAPARTEELFGPVATVIRVEDEAEAVRVANDTPYGLGAYVQSGDPARALRVAKALQSGTVNVNGAYLAAGSPFGGYKSSGNGREGGAFGLEEYLEVKAVGGYDA